MKDVVRHQKLPNMTGWLWNSKELPDRNCARAEVEAIASLECFRGEAIFRRSGAGLNQYTVRGMYDLFWADESHRYNEFLEH